MILVLPKMSVMTEVIFDKFNDDNIDLKLLKKNRVSKVMILLSKKNLKKYRIKFIYFSKR